MSKVAWLPMSAAQARPALKVCSAHDEDRRVTVARVVCRRTGGAWCMPWARAPPW